ncbi:unnamed protein product, partial [Iphiclides podalirius]
MQPVDATRADPKAARRSTVAPMRPQQRLKWARTSFKRVVLFPKIARRTDPAGLSRTPAEWFGCWFKPPTVAIWGDIVLEKVVCVQARFEGYYLQANMFMLFGWSQRETVDGETVLAAPSRLISRKFMSRSISGGCGTRVNLPDATPLRPPPPHRACTGNVLAGKLRDTRKRNQHGPITHGNYSRRALNELSLFARTALWRWSFRVAVR